VKVIQAPVGILMRNYTVDVTFGDKSFKDRLSVFLKVLGKGQRGSIQHHIHAVSFQKQARK
jgi:hypothetical protein